MSQKLEDWLDAVYETGGDRDKLDGLYDEWARSYDQPCKRNISRKGNQ